jgi:hypothetical protein
VSGYLRRLTRRNDLTGAPAIPGKSATRNLKGDDRSAPKMYVFGTLCSKNIRNGLNGFQFSYDIPPDELQIFVQAYSSANAATYDNVIWEKYRMGEALAVRDPQTDMPATRNLWFATPVLDTTFTPGVQPVDLEHGTPRTLFETGIMTPDSRFDVTADGRRFIIPTAVSNGSAPATFVVNWTKTMHK